MFLMRFRPSVPICPLFSIFSAGDDDDDDLISDDHLKVTFLTVPRNKLPYTRLVDIVVSRDQNGVVRDFRPHIGLI